MTNHRIQWRSKWLARWLLGCALLWLGLALPVRADGVADEADLQFQLGTAAWTKNDYESALEHFLASNRLVRNRNVVYNIARLFEQLGKFPDAYRYYVAVLRENSDDKWGNESTRALRRLAPKVAVIHVTTEPAGATVYINRKNLGAVDTTPSQLGLAGGEYTILVEKPGYVPYRSKVIDGQIGGDYELSVTLEPILGDVAFNGPKGVEVRIDRDTGGPSCVVPCTLSLRPGDHTAYFSKTGFTAPSQRFTVKQNAETSVNVDATALVGSLLVSAEETNALVEIDGNLAGFTPTLITGVQVGTRHVRVSLSGFAPVEQDIEIVANQQSDLRDVVMMPERSVAAASRESENIDDAPASVTVISKRELEAFAYPTVLEALRGVRGFATGYDSVYGTASVRGLGEANDYNNRVLLLSDGAVLNDAFVYQAFLHYDARVDLGDVERLEIVRGPASVLYGNGAVSGVLNLVLRERAITPGVSAEVSSFDNHTMRARLHAATGNAQRGAWASVAIGGSQGRSATLHFEPAEGAPAADFTTDTFDKFYAATLVGKAWYRKLALQWFSTSRTAFVPTGNASTFNDPHNTATDGRTMVELKYQTALGATSQLTLRGLYNYSKYRSYDGVSDTSLLAVDYNHIERYGGQSLGAEARIAWQPSSKLKFTISSEATTALKQSMFGQDILANGELETTLQVEAPWRLFAASMVADWKPTTKLHINAGVRFDYNQQQGNSESQRQDNGKAAYSAYSPRLALIAKPRPTDIVKVIVGRAFRAPSTYEYFYNDGGLDEFAGEFATIQPERVYAGELEYSHRFNRTWSLLLAAHTLYSKGAIEAAEVPDDPTTLYYRNSTVGKQTVGGDIELRRELGAGVSASAYYGYLHNSYRSNPDGDETDTDVDLRLPNAPTHYAAAKVIFPISSGVNGALRATFEDRRRIDATVTARSDRAVVADAVVSGNLRRAGVRYAVGVYNLFNFRYALPALPFAASLMPQNGRSFIFSVAISR
jgi:outer membrane receptor protein involved in Fe transport